MFITFEGSEGSGKTTQIPKVGQFLAKTGYSVFSTREPGGTSIGDQIRQVLLANKNTEMHPRTEILLFQASRAQLVKEIIRPALASNRIVLSDRYADSTLAYQGYGRELRVARVLDYHRHPPLARRPDRTGRLDREGARIDGPVG